MRAVAVCFERARRFAWQCPQSPDKVRGVAGLCLNPPDADVVLRVDDKTAIEALDRTAPVLPLTAGTPQRHTHDCRRRGAAVRTSPSSRT